jgi:hypothetical protein
VTVRMLVTCGSVSPNLRRALAQPGVAWYKERHLPRSDHLHETGDSVHSCHDMGPACARIGHHDGGPCIGEEVLEGFEVVSPGSLIPGPS